MRREIEVLKKKIEKVSAEYNAELELSCGFYSGKVSEVFIPILNDLEEKFANTYGMTIEEYQVHEIKYAMKYDKCVFA